MRPPRRQGAGAGAARAAPTVRIEQDLRPVRFGFVVEPGKPSTVLRAIEAATLTWGGRFCPLIPRFKRRRVWDDGRSISPEEVMQGVIDAFEPDVLVTDNASEAAGLGYEAQRVLSIDALFKDDLAERPGLPMCFVYEELYEREFRFQQRHPRQLIAPVPAVGVPALLHAAMFGAIPSDEGRHRATLRALGAVEETVTAATMLHKLTATYPPLRMTVELLKYPTDSGLRVLVLDPTKTSDIIDYWNIRALGRRVLPLPIGWIDAMVPTLRDLIARAAMRASFLRSRSVDAQTFESAVTGVGAPPDSIVLHNGMPRLFPAWSREADRCDAWEPTAAHSSSSFPARERIELAPPALEWVEPRFTTRPLFALSIKASMYLESEIAQTIPSGVPGVGELFRVMSYPGAFWSTSRGFVRLTAGHDGDLWLTLPSADDAMKAWFASRGFSATPSSAGRLARQMQRILPTAFDASAVLRQPVVDVLAKAVRSPTRTVSDEELSEALGRVHRQKRKKLVEPHRERLLASGVLRPGMLATCSHCGQQNWYAFDALAAVVECERCVSDFELPVSRPPGRGAWGFRLRGPFAVEGAGQGAYAVMAVFAALSRARLLEGLTWTAGLDLEASDRTRIEADFVFCGRERVPGRNGASIIAVGEAKTGGAFGKPGATGKRSDFGPSEISKALLLAEKLPDVGFVFATLASSFDSSETRALSSFVRKQRRARRGPVLVLTAHELLETESLLELWRCASTGSEEEQLAFRLGHHPSFRAVGEATTKLHLGVPTSEGWPAFEGAPMAPRRPRRRRSGAPS